MLDKTGIAKRIAKEVQDGYYVIANVYKGQGYLNKFIKDLEDNGLSADYIKDPKTNKNYHPGVTVAISEIFGEVSSWGGFWAMQKINNNWNKISLKDMPIIYPKHFDKENIKKAKDHFNDIKNYLT
mgnify:CR=1 FL=1